MFRTRNDELKLSFADLKLLLNILLESGLWVNYLAIDTDTHGAAGNSVFKALAIASIASGFLAPAASPVDYLLKSLLRVDESGQKGVLVDHRRIVHHELTFCLMEAVIETTLALALGSAGHPVDKTGAVQP